MSRTDFLIPEGPSVKEKNKTQESILVFTKYGDQKVSGF